MAFMHTFFVIILLVIGILMIITAILNLSLDKERFNAEQAIKRYKKTRTDTDRESAEILINRYHRKMKENPYDLITRIFRYKKLEMPEMWNIS